LKKVKVCHFSSVHKIDDTRVFYRECVSLAQDFDVTFIGIGDFTGTIEGVKVIGIKPSCNRIFRLFTTGYKAFSEAIKTEAVLYHIHDPEMIPFGILLSFSGKKVIYDIHENTAGDILFREWIPIYLRKLFVNIYQLLLKAASNYLHLIPVIANNSFKERLFLKDGNYTIIQNYAPIKQLKPYRVKNRNQFSEINILYAGLIQDHYYNIHPILDALEILSKKGYSLKFHLIGVFGWGNIEEVMLKHPKLNKELIEFYGKLKPEEVYEISKKCLVGICLKNQPDELVFSHERKLFEYIGLGLPSILCNQKIYLELNNKNEIGIAVNLTSEIEISKALELLITDKNLHQRLSENCLELADKITNWEAEYLKLKNCYTNLIAAN
jgi:glycosyltransferase involved in cell wall biosynthesis